MDLNEIREHLDRIDSALLLMVAERMSFMPKVAKYKLENNLPRFHPEREAQIIQAKRKMAEQLGVEPELAQELMELLIKYSHKIQVEVMGE